MTTVSWSQVSTTRNAGDGLAVDRQVFRSHLVQTSEHLDADSELNRTRSTTSSQCSWLCQKWVSPGRTCACLRRFVLLSWEHVATCRSSSSEHQSGDCCNNRLVINAWTSVATESSSRERRMQRSCRSWKKHLALTMLTCLFSVRSDEVGLREHSHLIGQREQHQVSKHDRSQGSLPSCA